MHDDIACQKVLAKDGFVQVGPARAQRQARGLVRARPDRGLIAGVFRVMAGRRSW
jgi:hypothetical protein